MKLLEERIRQDGVVKTRDILKVDSFLNHQMDVKLFYEMAQEWKRRFADERITKIVTIEASGIGIAAVAALVFEVPVVFAKKSESINLDGSMYRSKVHSFTHERDYDVIVSKKFLQPDDRVLLIDDFLANGCALAGLIEIVRAAGAEIAGAGIAIEKGFEAGGARIRGMGVRVESLAVIERMDPQDGISFRVS